jgi:hypothetical protein
LRERVEGENEKEFRREGERCDAGKKEIRREGEKESEKRRRREGEKKRRVEKEMWRRDGYGGRGRGREE